MSQWGIGNFHKTQEAPLGQTERGFLIQQRPPSRAALKYNQESIKPLSNSNYSLQLKTPPLSNSNSELQLLPPKHKPPNLEKVLEVDERHAGPDAVGAEGAKVFAVDHQIRAPAGS